MVRLNPLAIAKLKTQQRSQPQQAQNLYCYLEVEGGDRFDFLLNPSEIQQRISANYETLPSAGVNGARLQYRYGEFPEITLSGLIMMSPQHQASLSELLEAGKKLTQCDPDKKKFAAPVCSFVWGSRKIPACVIKSFEFVEKMWDVAGNPVHAEGSMSIAQIVEETPAKAPTGSASTSAPKLTQRELESGSKGAIAWIKQNPLKLPASIQQRAKLGQYRIKTDTTSRQVAITDSAGKVLATIGTNDRGVFNVAN